MVQAWAGWITKTSRITATRPPTGGGSRNRDMFSEVGSRQPRFCFYVPESWKTICRHGPSPAGTNMNSRGCKPTNDVS
jgi:hypothetical protein